jgi:hypothetical protein
MKDHNLTGQLHRGEYIETYLSTLRKQYEEEVRSIEWLNATQYNIEQIKDRLLSKYKIGPVKLLDSIPSTPKRITKTFKNDWGQSYQKDVQEMEISLGFEGDGYLFLCTLSQNQIVYPEYDSIDNLNKFIRFRIVLETLDKAEYDRKVNKIRTDFGVNIPTINKDISSYSITLENSIDEIINKQLDFVKKKESFLNEIGLVKNSFGQEITPQIIKKKVIPQINKPSEDKRSKNSYVTLKQDIYQDILTTINNVGKAIEKKPNIYKEKDEPALRDILLLFLETRYEGTTATGETFNKSGKTDILLKYANTGENLFVGECKIWRGKNDFFNAIDQLLGYLTLRDTKTALIIFV